MKKLSISALILVFVMVFSLSSSAVDLTAKSYGMGGANTGLADDATAILYNPAGLSDSGFLGLQMDFGLGASDISKFNQLRDDIEYLSQDFDTTNAKSINDIFNEFPVIDANGQLFVGGNFSSFGVGLNVDNEFQTEKVSADVINANNTTNTSGILSISREVETGFDQILGLAYGLNFKTLKTNYIGVTLDKPSGSETTGKQTTVNANGSGIGVDAGLMANLTERIKVGVNFKNLLAPAYDLEGEKKEYTYDATNGSWSSPTVTDYTEEYTPEKSIRVGGSVDIPVVNARVLGDIESFTSTGKSVVHLGAEKNLMFNGLSLRGGMYAPSDNEPTYTMGLGFNLAALHFDVAVGSNDGFNDNLNGVMSMNFQF
ncbi:MAG: hypothetical protein K9K76_03855 [Halanaerobiales bacterium]|nr:hypothetical protein [Halanaerobiales bacterium]